MDSKCAHSVILPVQDLKPHPKNPNKHSQEQIDRLSVLIKYQGFRHPIIVSKRSGFIVAGHGRLEAAKRLKMTSVPVDFQDFPDDDAEYAFLVSDNAIASWAELDLAGINASIGDLGPDFDINLLAIKDFVLEPAEKLEPGCDEDEVPETVEPRTKPGDIYQLGRHRLMCGDSTVITDVERLMGGERAMLIATDPPYGINHVEVAQEKGQSKGYAKIANDDKQDEDLKAFIYQAITTAIAAALAPGFAFYMWHAMKMQAYFSQAAAAAAGILFHRQIIWMKPQFVFGRGHYHWRHELCLMGWLQGNEPPFYGERNQSTVWEIGRENDKIHPTQKPVRISEIPMENHTKPGDAVYEPFAGSGGMFIAAEKLGRRCFGMEIDPHYCDVVVSRWEQYTGKKAELISPSESTSA
jgi:DNA modification methylase